MATAKINLEFGELHPFDESEGESKDWSHMAARGLVAYMQDKPELNAVLEAMDGAMRSEFIAAVSDIIQEAQAQDGANNAPPEADMPVEE